MTVPTAGPATGDPARHEASAEVRDDPATLLLEQSDAAFARGLGVFVLCWQAGQAVLMFMLVDRYHHPAIPIAAWVITMVVAILGVRVSLRRPLRAAEGVGLLAVVNLAEVVVGCQCRGYSVVSFANWAALGSAGLIGLVAGSRPAREWVTGAVALLAVFSAETIDQVGTTSLGLSRLIGAAFGQWTILLMVAMARPALHTTARSGALLAEQEIALAAEQESRAAVRHDRRGRLETLQARTLPLLRAVANGSLDPDDEAVRGRCGAEAASLRRMLAGADRPTASLGGLVPAIEAAERRGVAVELQVFGDPTQIPVGARADIERPVAAAVAAVDGGSILITLLPGSREARAFVSFPLAGTMDWPPTGGTDFTSGGNTEVLAEVSDDRACLEVRWPRGGIA